MSKSRDAFRTISEVAELLDTPAHVLRFWESKFTQVKPVKRAGGRRYYRPGDIGLLAGIRKLLHDDGMTIKGVQKILREQGVDQVKNAGAPDPAEAAPVSEPAARRGRRPTAKSVAGRRAKSQQRTVLSTDARTNLEMAISELQACRSLLLGKAIESSARRRAKSRRAARP